jgi:hypothetical protein
MTNRHQRTFNPADYAFCWTDDGWYRWDREAGHKAALKARNAVVKQLRADGYKVTSFTLREQIVRKGGIGSGKPDVEFCVNCYGYNAERVG